MGVGDLGVVGRSPEREGREDCKLGLGMALGLGEKEEEEAPGASSR